MQPFIRDVISAAEKRLISAETETPDKFRKGNFEDYEYQQIHDRIGKLSKAPLFIDDTLGLNVFG